MEELKWSVHSIRTEKKKAVIFIVVIGAAVLGIYIETRSLFWLFLSLFLLLFTLREFIFPVHYILSESHVISKFLFFERKKPWSYFKRYYLDRNGIFLSPFPRSTPLENFRGMYLRFFKNEKEVLEYVKRHLGLIFFGPFVLP
jgi:hypothetical protein